MQIRPSNNRSWVTAASLGWRAACRAGSRPPAPLWLSPLVRSLALSCLRLRRSSSQAVRSVMSTVRGPRRRRHPYWYGSAYGSEVEAVGTSKCGSSVAAARLGALPPFSALRNGGRFSPGWALYAYRRHLVQEFSANPQSAASARLMRTQLLIGCTEVQGSARQLAGEEFENVCALITTDLQGSAVARSARRRSLIIRRCSAESLPYRCGLSGIRAPARELRGPVGVPVLLRETAGRSRLNVSSSVED